MANDSVLDLRAMVADVVRRRGIGQSTSPEPPLADEILALLGRPEVIEAMARGHFDDDHNWDAMPKLRKLMKKRMRSAIRAVTR